MFHLSLVLALCMGTFAGWAIIFLTRGFWLRSVEDAQERNALRKLAPMGGMFFAYIITIIVLIQPSIELKALLVPIAAIGTLCCFAVGAIYLAVFDRLSRRSCKSDRKH